MDFTDSLFSEEVNLNYVVLLLKTPHSQSYFVLFMYLWFAETDQYQGSREGLHSPSQILSTKFLMLILAPFIYCFFFPWHKK